MQPTNMCLFACVCLRTLKRHTNMYDVRAMYGMWVIVVVILHLSFVVLCLVRCQLLVVYNLFIVIDYFVRCVYHVCYQNANNKSRRPLRVRSNFGRRIHKFQHEWWDYLLKSQCNWRDTRIWQAFHTKHGITSGIMGVWLRIVDVESGFSRRMPANGIHQRLCTAILSEQHRSSWHTRKGMIVAHKLHSCITSIVSNVDCGFYMFFDEFAPAWSCGHPATIRWRECQSIWRGL